jgi:paraquat-inducible protein B
MQSLLKATHASVALAAALSLCPLSLIAQNATSNDAVPPGTTSDPLADDETTPTEETIADPAATVEASPDDTIGVEQGSAPEEATTEGTQPELVTEEEFSEIEDAGADPADDDSEGSGNQARLAAALASAEEAAADIREAAARLPDIVDRIDALVGKLEELPVEELVTELTSLATSANTLVSSEATQALPADLSAALGEVEAILREIREGGVIDNANATLQSTRAAADTLPGLAERAGVLLDQAGVTIESFQGSGSILREAERAIREVGDAADAVASLARAIERDPNSLIFGRR